MSRAQLLPLLACLALVLAVAPTTAFAAAELTVSPTILELQSTAGATLTADITATAGQDQAIVVELIHADFGFDGSTYLVTLIRDEAPETTSFSTRGWFSLPKPQYRIRAGETVTIPLTIKVPANTPGGTYLGAALLRVKPAERAGGSSQVQAVPETGPLAFISVEGGDPPKPAIKTFDVPRLISKGPIKPKIVIENRGDEFFTYEGSLTRRGPGTDDNVEITRQFVVPNEPRLLRTSAKDQGAAGRPTLGGARLGIGRHEVVATLRIEPAGTKLTSTRVVWVIPVWIRIVGLALLLVLLVCIGLLAQWAISRQRRAVPAEGDSDADSIDENSDDDEGSAPIEDVLGIDELEDEDLVD